MSKRPPKMTLDETPVLDAAERRRAAAAAADTLPETEMLSARISGALARRFRAFAKIRGETVQLHLDRAVSEYLERNRN